MQEDQYMYSYGIVIVYSCLSIVPQNEMMWRYRYKLLLYSPRKCEEIFSIYDFYNHLSVENIFLKLAIFYPT